MSAVLSTDAWPYRALTRGVEWVQLSLVWWLLCLPVVTIPVATQWLIDALRRTAAGEPVGGVAATLRFLRRRFGTSWRLAGVHIAVVALLSIALLGPDPGGVLGVAVLVLAVPLAVTWALIAPWSVVLHTCLGWRDALRTAYLRALRRLGWSALAAVGVAGAGFALVSGPSWLQLIIPLVAPAATAALVITTCDRAAPPVVPDQPEPSTRTVRSPEEVQPCTTP